MQDVTTPSKQDVQRMMPLVYEQLRRRAACYLYAERRGHTLRATALVHEAYLKLAGADREWTDRGAFFAAAAQAMRRILIDYARAHARQKRGCGAETVPLEDALALANEDASALLDLDEALRRLAVQDARKGQIIELLYFGGLTYEECASVLKISPATLHRELKLAKAWLYHELTQSRGEQIRT